MQAEPGHMHVLPEIQPPLRFPYCIVWTPIPVLSWLLPVVGHMGVCSSDGTIHDFAGPFYVNVGALSFGDPTRYWQLDPAEAAALVSASQTTDVRALDKGWDNALQVTKHAYQQRRYDFFADNCHCFAARMLNTVQYASSSRWGMVLLAAEVFRRGRFVGFVGFLKTWGPLAFLLAVGAAVVGIYWLAGWLALLAVIAAAFLLRTKCIRKDATAMYRASSV